MIFLAEESIAVIVVPSANPTPKMAAPTDNPSTDFKITSFAPATKAVSTSNSTSTPIKIFLRSPSDASNEMGAVLVFPNSR